MKVNTKSITSYELIGLDAEIIDSKNKSNVGIKGKIKDETKNTLTIKQKENKKILLKDNITIKIKLNDQTIIIEGKRLSGRPKERIKK